MMKTFTVEISDEQGVRISFVEECATVGYAIVVGETFAKIGERVSVIEVMGVSA
jgi:hypothetical protein